MPARIVRLRTRRDRIEVAEGAELRRMIAERAGLPERARGEIIAAIDRETASANRWTFVMLSPTQNRAVVRWLLEHSSRPQRAVDLWALLFEHLDRETGEIVLSRQEMAAEIGETPGNVSHILSELETIGAISRCRVKVPGLKGRGMVRCFMNPNVGTHLTGRARDNAQREVGPLRLVTEPA